MTRKKWVDSTHLQFDIRVVCHLEGQSNDTRVRVETTHLFLQCIVNTKPYFLQVEYCE